MSLKTARFHQFTRKDTVSGPVPSLVDNVANPYNISTATDTVNITTTHSTAAGNSIIIAVAVNGGPDLVVTDSVGNKYKLDNTILSGVTTSVHVLSAHNVKALPQNSTITIKFYGFVSGSTVPQTRDKGSIQIYDFANLSGIVEDVSAGSADTDQSSIQQGTVQTTSGNPMYFTAYGIIGDDTALTFVPESGYTNLAPYSSGGTSSSVRGLQTAWKTTTNYGYQTANATISRPRRYAAVTVAYKARYIGHGTAGDKAAPASRTRNVTTSDELITALNLANAGDLIHVASGTYIGSFKAPNRRGTEAKPIRLVAEEGVILDGNNLRGYCLWLYRCEHWNVSGPMVLQSNLKGIILDMSQYCVIDGVTVQNIKQEGIHLRNESCFNIVQNCTVQDVGTETPGFGEALYVGSAYSNWGSPTDRASRMPEEQIGFPDKSDNNSFIANTLKRFPADGIDIKEGTTGTIIRANIIDGSNISGQNGAEQWIDIKGQACVVSENQCINTLKYGMATEREDPPVRFLSPYIDGFGVLQPGIKLGSDNIFSNNTMTPGATAEYAIAIKYAENTGNVVDANNTVIGTTPLTNTNPVAV
jgi:hypothetical protein